MPDHWRMISALSFPLKHALYELDGVLMLGDRIVVPADLRPAVLALLHACNKLTKSNPTQPPIPLADPQFPFQQLSADYFHYGGHYYAVIDDLYSHWPVIFRAEQDCTGSNCLISYLRLMFSTFGVPEEIASAS